MRFVQTATIDMQGAIDGVNRTFVTTLPMALSTTVVFLNGRLKVASWDDGYVLQDARTVVMNEPPLPGDSVQVGFDVTSSSLGGAGGGVPPPAAVVSLGQGNLRVTSLQPPTVQVHASP